MLSQTNIDVRVYRFEVVTLRVHRTPGNLITIRAGLCSVWTGDIELVTTLTCLWTIWTHRARKAHVRIHTGKVSRQRSFLHDHHTVDGKIAKTISGSIQFPHHNLIGDWSVTLRLAQISRAPGIVFICWDQTCSDGIRD